jgi:hypothetical protein
VKGEKTMSDKTYQTVTLEDIKSVLQFDKGWRIVEDPKSHEYIFEFPLTTSPWIVVRVASSLQTASVVVVARMLSGCLRLTLPRVKVTSRPRESIALEPGQRTYTTQRSTASTRPSVGEITDECQE